MGGYDTGGWGRFAHTVLVDMRARLDASEDPRRIFKVTVAAASAAGLVGAKRVLDSTPLYDAVAHVPLSPAAALPNVKFRRCVPRLSHRF